MSRVHDAVVDIIVEEIDVDRESVTLGAAIIDDLGADSLDVVELIMRFEDAFGVEIPDAEAEKLVTVHDIVTYIENVTE
jgi:acyl carrier protein